MEWKGNWNSPKFFDSLISAIYMYVCKIQRVTNMNKSLCSVPSREAFCDRFCITNIQGGCRRGLPCYRFYNNFHLQSAPKWQIYNIQVKFCKNLQFLLQSQNPSLQMYNILARKGFFSQIYILTVLPPVIQSSYWNWIFYFIFLTFSSDIYFYEF